ncbi:uncharacterized protein [Argopecten irradians]|uniref:uncharacterized protein n=1 Tax=Argopecten irradians TaxID=31199 RepID=UPI00371C4199
MPRRIHSDQGANFVGNLIHQLCDIANIKKSRTTPYHPMGNGSCERFNRTLLGMLGTLDPKDKGDWKRHVGPLVHAYNSIRHDSTGYSPFYLMFGRHPRLPIDLAFGLDIGGKHPTLSKYVSSLRDNLKKSYDLARQYNSVASEHQKRNYDKRARATTLQEGDRVLVRIMAFEGKHKDCRNKWEDDDYVVVRQPNMDVPGKTRPEAKEDIRGSEVLEDSDEDDDSSVVIVDDTEAPGSRHKEGGEQNLSQDKRSRV